MLRLEPRILISPDIAVKGYGGGPVFRDIPCRSGCAAGFYKIGVEGVIELLKCFKRRKITVCAVNHFFNALGACYAEALDSALLVSLAVKRYIPAYIFIVKLDAPFVLLVAVPPERHFAALYLKVHSMKVRAVYGCTEIRPCNRVICLRAVVVKALFPFGRKPCRGSGLYTLCPYFSGIFVHRHLNRAVCPAGGNICIGRRGLAENYTVFLPCIEEFQLGGEFRHLYILECQQKCFSGIFNWLQIIVLLIPLNMAVRIFLRSPIIRRQPRLGFAVGYCGRRKNIIKLRNIYIGKILTVCKDLILFGARYQKSSAYNR